MSQPEGTLQLPPQLSTLAPTVDWIYYFLYWVSVVFFVGIVGTMVWYVIKYRRRPGHRAEPTGHAPNLELFWTFTPLILLVLLFHWGFQGYMQGAVPPPSARQVRVRGVQWTWTFEHANGVPESGELTVPLGEPVRLVMSSEDVIHSFFVPAFRVKRDVVPGIYTTLWFEATALTHHYDRDESTTCRRDADCGEGRYCVDSAEALDRRVCASRASCEARDDCPGDHACVNGQCETPVEVYCAEYCGAPAGATGNAGHSAMLSSIHVVTPDAYQRLLDEGPPMPPECEGTEDPLACWGRDLYMKNCIACHNTDGVTAVPGPNFAGLWGRSEQLATGESVVVDENYVRESILQPQAKVVAGYEQIVMPPFRFSDRQIDATIAYLKSLERQGP